jgi:DNA-binding NarL/FixJ family response regulator
VLILSAYDETDEVTAALVAGASGYVLKTVSSERLAGNIRSVHSGEVLLSPVIAAKIIEQLSRLHEAGTDRDEALSVLTPREREVFGLASQGLRNAEIAAKLYLSEKTIKTHLRNIYGKLALGSKADLRVYAERLGLGSEPNT